MNQLIKDMALERGVKPYAIRKWKLRGFVPHEYRLPMFLEAQERGAELSEKDFDFGRKVKPRRAAKRVRS